MKRITKRITALIIAAMMLASMIPAAFAATGAETVKEKYEFLFTRDSHGFTSNVATSQYTLDNNKEGYDAWGCINAYRANNSKVYNKNASFDRATDSLTYNYLKTNAETAFLALEIVIGQPGTYTPNLTWETRANSPYVDLYLIEAPTDEATVAEWKKTAKGNTSLSTLSTNDKFGTVKMQPTNDGGDESGKVALSTVTIADGAEGNYYLIFDPVGASDAALSANETLLEMRLNSFSLTRVADDPIAEAFEVTDTPTGYTAPTAIGITKDETEIETTDNEDGTFDLTAPETNSKSEKFLYWALGLTGNKRIVSFDRTLENYMPAEEGRNYLIAVYEGDVDTSKVEYYNQNGQLIPDATENETVSMPGYGSTRKWKKYSDNIYVADYEKTEEDKAEVTVTAVGGTVDGELEATVSFGTEVTCTAAAKDGSGKPFKCWKKSNLDGDEIVSTDSTYKFKAWEDCTVTAVYEEHIYFGESMKIIIDSFAVGNDTGVMAEFIGLDSAVEKGIMFTDSEENTTKIAMTTKDSQFTVTADKPGTYVGYAILKSGDNAFTLITDGSYEKK
ncbi:MAG: hypothetical protein IJO61_03825 [Oscillospiraceae bacterium]|nr:hypothetical protein [Oscillospiraceae bacterium]